MEVRVAIGTIDALRRAARARIVREAIAAAAIACWGVWEAVRAEAPGLRAAAVGVVFAAVGIVGYLAARGRVREGDAFRDALLAQAALLRSAWAWYATPLVGSVAIYIGVHLVQTEATSLPRVTTASVVLLLLLVVWGVIVRVNRDAATTLEDEANSLPGD